MRIRDNSTLTKAMVLGLLAFLALTASLYGSETKVSCGEIIGGNFAEARSYHDYLLKMDPGEVIKFRTVPTGDFLKFRARVQDPVGNSIYYSGDRENYMQHRLNVETGKLSAYGTYRITLWNHETYNSSSGHVGIYTLHIGCVRNDGTEIEPGSQNGTTPKPVQTATPPPVSGFNLPVVPPATNGSSTLEKINGYAQMADDAVVAAEGIANVVSTLREIWPKRRKKSKQPISPPPGWQATPPTNWQTSSFAPSTDQHKITAPPSTPAPNPAPNVAPLKPATTVAPLQPSGSTNVAGQGFPGLTAADLATLQLPSMALGQELQGSILAAGRQIAGFRFVAEAGSEIDLAFERLVGDMNLGLLLLNPSRQIAFKTSLVMNKSFETRLVIPTRGEYTLGIAKIDPLPPTPNDTSFKIHLAPAQPARPQVQQLVPVSQQVAQVAPLQATAQKNAQPIATRRGVTLYEHAHFEGRHETFYIDDPSLRDNRIGNKVASSIRVDPGCQALLHRKSQFQDSPYVLTRNASNLRELKIGNDSISSIQVQCE